MTNADRDNISSPTVEAGSLDSGEHASAQDKGWLGKFFFTPTDATTLGFCRFVLMLGAFFFYRTRNFESWGYVRDSFWQAQWLFERLHWHPLSPGAMGAIGLAWKISLLLGAIGLFTRASCAVAFVLGLYLIGLPNNIGKVDHNDAIVLWSFLVLAIARCGDAWSLDSLLRAARRGDSLQSLNLKPADDIALAHAEYRWPLRVMQVLMAVVFCAAGLAKLRASGLSWALSDNLRNTFIQQQYLSNPPLDWGLWIASHRWLCVTLAITTLICETAAPLALFSRTARWLLLPSLFLMQVGNELVLGINFRQFMLCYAFWVPWSDLGRSLRRSMNASSPGPVTVLFDGSCGLCKRTMTLVRRLDLLRRVQIMDVMNDWPNVSAKFPTLDQNECLRIMHSVAPGGQVTTGFHAYRTMCKVIPLGWLMLPLLYLPGVPKIGAIVYQKIADGRFRTACRIPIAPTPAR